jgi:hypothetical protein
VDLAKMEQKAPPSPPPKEMKDFTETPAEKKTREEQERKHTAAVPKERVKLSAEIRTDPDKQASAFMVGIIKEYSKTVKVQAICVKEPPRVHERKNSQGQPEKKQRLDSSGQSSPKFAPSWCIPRKDIFLDKFKRFAVFQCDKQKITLEGFFCPYETFRDFDQIKRKTASNPFIFVKPGDLLPDLPGERPVSNLAPFIEMEVAGYGNLRNIGTYEATDIAVERRIRLLKGGQAIGEAEIKLGNAVGTDDDIVTFRTILRAFCLGSTSDAGVEEERYDRKVHADNWINLESELMHKRMQLRHGSFNVWEVFMKLTDTSVLHLIDATSGRYIKACLDPETNKAFTAFPDGDPQFFPDLVKHFQERSDNNNSQRSQEWLWLDKVVAYKFGWINGIYAKGTHHAFYETADQDGNETVFVPAKIVEAGLAKHVFKAMLREVVDHYNSQQLQNELLGIDGKSTLWTQVLSKLCRVPGCANSNNCSLFH